MSGVLNVPAGCVDFTVLLEGPIIEYTSVISHTGEATDTASGDASQCLLAAEYPEHGHKDVQPQCEAHTLDVRENKSEAKSYTQLLRVQSSCSTDSIDLKVLYTSSAQRNTSHYLSKDKSRSAYHLVPKISGSQEFYAASCCR